METIAKICFCAITVALFIYLVMVGIDLFNYLFRNYPADGKSELHSRYRYEVAEKMKNDDSDLGIFMN